MNYTEQEIEAFKKKADKWDKLQKSISKYFCNENGEYDEENPENPGDLTDIGETTARHFGYL